MERLERVCFFSSSFLSETAEEQTSGSTLVYKGMKGGMSLWRVVREHLGMQVQEGADDSMVGGQGAPWYAGE